jgi:hypothetical protein
MKFYANHQDAELALAKQVDMQSVLGTQTNATLHDGCCVDGICVIVDDFIEHEDKITFPRLINVAKMVDKVFQAGRVHGDMRLPNILFGPGDTVHLIDFDWSGAAGEGKFPPHPNAVVFGRHSSTSVTGSKKIPSNFDWLCLADLLEHTGRPAAVSAALSLNLTGVCAALSSFTADEEERLSSALFPPSNGACPALNLHCIGIAFYEHIIKPAGTKRGRKADSDSSGAKHPHLSV